MANGSLIISRNKAVFICSPYRGTSEAEQIRNVSFAKRYCKMALLMGYTPFAPHLLFPQLLDDSKENEREAGICCGLEFLRHCSELWICGTKITDGMRREIQFAKLCDIPVKEIQIDLDDM